MAVDQPERPAAPATGRRSAGTDSPLLVSVAELSALSPARAVVVDCRFDLARPGAGRTAWLEGHIPGARYAHLDEDLASPPGPGTGRHPLPDPAAFAATCARLGISRGSWVIAYDDASGAFAARLWWLLRWAGHPAVSLLDGGIAAWRAAGLPVESGPGTVAPAVFRAASGAEPTVAAGELAAGLAAGSRRLVDVRAPERFAGRVEPIDPVAGHVPGAVNLPFARALGPDQRFRPPDELRELYAPLLEGRVPADVVFMCGSGVTACHGIFAMTLAGLPGATLYPGSWSEWIRDPARPVATG
ncbi:MAG: sulfurtransferase [Chromatiales bacterium]|jgi:thiosulfate/3-mercaptopyruvate sulfurtransferase|nr:sulfurtransferase [Chromatiales bacterium]